MASNTEDETLLCQGFSQDLAVNLTTDEDIIPPSQPHSNENTNNVKKLDSGSQQIEDSKDFSDKLSTGLLSTSETAVLQDISVNQSIEQDQSSDFIPETDSKKRKDDCTEFIFCNKKKLQIEDSFIKNTDSQPDADINEHFTKISESTISPQALLKVPECSLMETQETSKLSESFFVETQNISEINSSVLSCQSSIQNINKNDIFNIEFPENKNNKSELITEIVVNDSAETIELDTSENLSLTIGKVEESKNPFSSCSSGTEKCEDVQIFDNSLDLPEPLCFTSNTDQKSENSNVSQQMILKEIVENNELQEQKGISHNMSKRKDPETDLDLIDTGSVGLNSNQLETFTFKNKQQTLKPTFSSNGTNNVDSSSWQTKAMEFKLSVSCMVTINVKTKEVIQKLIVNVNEIPKLTQKSVNVNNRFDTGNNSDKFKRCSTSSSGSVYSDKSNIPFPLPKRISSISDQTDTSDSSEEGFAKLASEEKKALHRTPWSNEHLVFIKMDELLKELIENQDFLSRPNNKAFPRKLKCVNQNRVTHLKEILERSSFGEASIDNSDSRSPKKNGVQDSIVINNSKLLSRRGTLLEVNTKIGNEKSESVVNDDYFISSQPQFTIAKENCESGDRLVNVNFNDEKHIEEKEPSSNENEYYDIVQLQKGLKVFARWTDKRYYSGVLMGIGKNDRWEVKFDDGTIKLIREDFLIPSQWLQKGELVFVLVDDVYLSGQIINVNSERDVQYTIELDNENKTIVVNLSDLCLTEVMAGIVKEKHKPLRITSHGKRSSEIDFDNVLSGKRVRDQKTPLKRLGTALTGNLEKKKKSSANSNKGNEMNFLENISIKETPQKKALGKKRFGRKINVLQAENGHLVEDEKISTDSFSSGGTIENSIIGSNKKTRRKAKPRSLSYEADRNMVTPKFSEWVAADGTPIPGPSGVKFKKRSKSGSGKREGNSDLNEEEITTPKRRKRNSGKHEASNSIISERNQKNSKNSSVTIQRASGLKRTNRKQKLEKSAQKSKSFLKSKISQNRKSKS